MFTNLIKTLSEISGPDNNTGYDFPDLDDIQVARIYLAKRPVSLDYLRGVAGLAIPKDIYQQECDALERRAFMKVGSNSTVSQWQRISSRLKEKSPLTTPQTRYELDCMNPGMRICELRKAEHDIQTVWVNELAPESCRHRAGKHILEPPKQLNLFDFVKEEDNGC